MKEYEGRCLKRKKHLVFNDLLTWLTSTERGLANGRLCFLVRVVCRAAPSPPYFIVLVVLVVECLNLKHNSLLAFFEVRLCALAYVTSFDIDLTMLFDLVSFNNLEIFLTAEETLALFVSKTFKLSFLSAAIFHDQSLL